MSKSMRTLLYGASVLGVSAAATVFTVGAARADVLQTPVVTTCPASYQFVSVAGMEATGPYIRPRIVDTAGNNDGYVCVLQLPDAARDADCRAGGHIACLLEALGLPLYHFTDDDNPASQNAHAGG